MSFSYTQLAKNMLSRLLQIRKKIENMLFSNMQLAKKHDTITIFMTS